MKWNTQKLKEGEYLKKNKLYELSENQRTAVFREEHEDSIPELVEIEFQIPQCGRAVAANEYRNKDYKDSKAADILCIILDEPAQKHGAVGQKYYIATVPLRKELEMIENFEKKKIKVLNRMYDLQVILLEFSEEKNAFYQKIVLEGEKACSMNKCMNMAAKVL